MGVSPRAHTVIKLAVGLLTVDDVEAVRDASSHAAHLEVEPLLVLAAIHISVDQQVVLPPAKSEARLEGYGSSKDRPTLRSYTPRVPEDGSKTRDLSRLVSYSDCAHKIGHMDYRNVGRGEQVLGIRRISYTTTAHLFIKLG